jgi:hypothetical protein
MTELVKEIWSCVEQDHPTLDAAMHTLENRNAEAA